MPKQPSLDDLARFRKVIEKGSFVAAARDLGIPKSTLSKAVARLETDLGARLLERTTRNLRPTETGRIVAAHSKTMVDAFEAARLAAAASDGPSGRLRISCPPGLLENLVEDVIVRFLESFPRVDIVLRTGAGPVDLIADDVDIALRARASMEAGSSFVVRRLGMSRGVLVAAPALLRDTGPIADARALTLVPTLAMPGDTGEWVLYDDDGTAHSVPVAPRLITSSIGTLRKAALGGLGVVQLPEHLCLRELASGELERVLPLLTTINGIVFAVFSRETARSPALRAFIDHLVLELGRMPGTPG